RCRPSMSRPERKTPPTSPSARARPRRRSRRVAGDAPDVAMRPLRWVRGVVVLGLAGALVGVVPNGVAAAAGRQRCRPTAFVTNRDGSTVSTIDVKTKTKNPTDIPVDSQPSSVTITPNGKTAFVTRFLDDSVSTIDVKTPDQEGPGHHGRLRPCR